VTYETSPGRGEKGVMGRERLYRGSLSTNVFHSEEGGLLSKGGISIGGLYRGRTGGR